MKTSDFDVVVIGGGFVGSRLAVGLAEKRLRVALVERGGRTMSEQVEATPIVKCSNRVHLGCFQARNHVLGGNGYYWGAGLMRPPDTTLEKCLGLSKPLKDDSESLTPHFENIEALLGLHHPPVRVPFPVGDPEVRSSMLSEVHVLPGRERNSSRKFLDSFNRMAGCETLTTANICSFTSAKVRQDVRIESVVVGQAGGLRELTAQCFVIAAGAIDSNLILLEHAPRLRLENPEPRLGSRLHDHLSVPIADVRFSSTRDFQDLLAPRFRNGLMVGRRFELQCETGWRAQGLLHFTFTFDEISPYREIKQLLSLRQQRAAPTTLARATMELLRFGPELSRIVIERFMNRRLYLSDRLSIRATVDFETFPHPSNALRLTGDGAELAWAITDEDELTYLELVNRANRLLTELAHDYGIAAKPLIELSSRSKAIDYLHAAATDAFHLGGGLPAAIDGMGAVDKKLRLLGTHNLYVISSAVMRRPGVVNPTHTLLALADRFVHQYKREI